MLSFNVVVGFTELIEVLAACEVDALMDFPNPSSSTVVDEDPMLQREEDIESKVSQMKSNTSIYI